MKFGVITFPGSNCDYDCHKAVEEGLGIKPVHIWHRETDLDGCDCIVLPGGFSYGDYLRTGAIARFSPIMQKVKEYAGRGGLVIGICNGFQILLESGLLPGAMMVNKGLQFLCRTVNLSVERNDLAFTNKLKKKQVIRIPVAHKEGNYYIDQKSLKELEDNGQVVFRYCDQNGQISDADNPNGSLNNIAGIVNKKGNVLGMMPHPERAMEKLLGSDQGRLVFESIKAHLQKTR
jgi:phosphoribosylformylglycinamidine synthase I